MTRPATCVADSSPTHGSTTHSRPVDPPLVSVGDLQRAWRAVKAGHFGNPSKQMPALVRAEPAVASWTPRPGERVIPVVGSAGSCGATTLALALAEVAEGRARVVECSGSVATSGLAAASNAELGLHVSGWLQGSRGRVILERASDMPAGPADIPVPSAGDEPVNVTVLDVAWELGRLLVAGPCWLAGQVTAANPVVVVATCTVPGLRRLESTLALLPATPTIAAVMGPPPKRWPKAARHSLGPLTRTLEGTGRLVCVPVNRRLAVTGLDPTPLPDSLLHAAENLAQLAADQLVKGNPA